jgi:hypothetical protein
MEMVEINGQHLAAARFPKLAPAQDRPTSVVGQKLTFNRPTRPATLSALPPFDKTENISELMLAQRLKVNKPG